MRSTRQQSHESNYRDSSVQTRVPLEQVKHFRLSLAEHPDIDMKMGAGLSHTISEFSAPPPTPQLVSSKVFLLVSPYRIFEISQSCWAPPSSTPLATLYIYIYLSPFSLIFTGNNFPTQ